MVNEVQMQRVRGARYLPGWTNALAFAMRVLTCPRPITWEILGYTRVATNIRLEISNIRHVVYFMKSQKLTINHVFNLKNDWVFPPTD